MEKDFISMSNINICTCEQPVSNCKNIDTSLWRCQLCDKVIIPGRTYNRHNDRATISIRGYWHLLKALLNKD